MPIDNDTYGVKQKASLLNSSTEDEGAIPNVKILGLRVHLVTLNRLHSFIYDAIVNQKKIIITHINVHCANLALEQAWLYKFINMSDLVFCDGAGVKFGARMLGHHIPERITYADWMWQVGHFAEKRKLSFFFLGGKPNVAEGAKFAMQKRFPNLEIVGTHHGYFNKQPGNPENEAVIEIINQAKPDILLVAFGMPLQERWLMENWEKVDARVALTGGAVFDYISGELRRAVRNG